MMLVMCRYFSERKEQLKILEAAQEESRSVSNVGVPSHSEVPSQRDRGPPREAQAPTSQEPEFVQEVAESQSSSVVEQKPITTRFNSPYLFVSSLLTGVSPSSHNCCYHHCYHHCNHHCNHQYSKHHCHQENRRKSRFSLGQASNSQSGRGKYFSI